MLLSPQPAKSGIKRFLTGIYPYSVFEIEPVTWFMPRRILISFSTIKRGDLKRE